MCFRPSPVKQSDSNQGKTCQTCGMPVADDASTCLYCGDPIPPSTPDGVNPINPSQDARIL